MIMSRADYYDRRAARLARLDGRARTLSAAASTLWQRASAMADRIPMGQPILVGHHSERRDRGYRARIRRTFERAHETQQAATDAARRAASPSRAISSDAPDAVALLRAKVAKLTAERDRAKAINRAVRLKDTAKGDAAMRALGLNDAGIASMREPDFAGRLGVPDYRLTNLGAEVRRAEARIAELEREAARPQAPAVEVSPGVVVSENVDANRIQIVFPGKPDDVTRAALELTCERVVDCDTDYGILHIHTFRDEAGNALVWRTTSRRIESGTRVAGKATVKAHGEYRGERQTELTRCAF